MSRGAANGPRIMTLQTADRATAHASLGRELLSDQAINISDNSIFGGAQPLPLWQSAPIGPLATRVFHLLLRLLRTKTIPGAKPFPSAIVVHRRHRIDEFSGAFLLPLLWPRAGPLFWSPDPVFYLAHTKPLL